MKKPHEADLATAQALLDADYFTVAIRHNNENVVHPMKTLDYARRAAKLLPEALQSNRKAIVYVVTKEGRVFMVPDNLPDPAAPAASTQEPK